MEIRKTEIVNGEWQVNGGLFYRSLHGRHAPYLGEITGLPFFWLIDV